jgi:hypothetical protein
MLVPALSPARPRSPSRPINDRSIALTPVRVRPMTDLLDTHSLDTHSLDTHSLDLELRQLIVAILALPPRTPAWRRQTNHFVRAVQQSKKLWRAPGTESELYNDVLAGVWEYVLKNFHKYDPDRGAVMTWINNRLKWDLKTSQGKHWEDLQHRISDFWTGHQDDPTRWLDRLQANDDGHFPLDQICQRWWEHRDQSTAIHVRHRPDINSYELFQDMLGLSCDPETWLDRRDRPTYRAMAAHYQAPLPTIASFWTTKCLPLIKQLYHDLDGSDAAP